MSDINVGLCSDCSNNDGGYCTAIVFDDKLDTTYNSEGSGIEISEDAGIEGDPEYGKGIRAYLKVNDEFGCVKFEQSC